MEDKKYKRPENEEEYLQMMRDRFTENWILIGKVEFNDPFYHEAPTGIFGSEDYLWVKFEERENVNNNKEKLYYWGIGIPPNSTNYVMKKPWTVIQILKYLVCSPVVAFGRTTERGTPVQRIPKECRLVGMTEWVSDPEGRKEATDYLYGNQKK